MVTCGVAVNFLPFTLHFRVDFLFGSIFALIALYMLPPLAGITAAALIALPTLFLWNHPLGLIMHTVEASLISILLRKTKLHLLTCATIVWFFLLPPMVYINMQTSGMFFPSAIRLFLLKYTINGVFNAAIAASMIFLFGLKITEGMKSDVQIKASEAVVNVFIIVTVIPLLIFTLLDSRILSSTVFSQILARQNSLKSSISMQIKLWHDRYISDLQLVTADLQKAQNSDQINATIATLCRASEGFKHLCIADATGNCVTCYPQGKTDDHLCSGSDISMTHPYRTAIDTGKPLISEIISGTVNDPEPVIIFSEPVFINGTAAGFAAGGVSPSSLSRQINHLFNNTARISIIDAQNKIVCSPDQTMVGKQYKSRLSQAISVMRGKLTLIPPSENMVASSKFRNSTIFFETPLAVPANWNLIIEEPMTEHVEKLFALSFQQFLNISGLTLFLVILSGFIRKYFSLPLQELSNYTNEIATTGFCNSAYQSPQSNIFEIKQLVENFSAATEKIVESQNLEKEKNRQLQFANEELRNKMIQLKRTQFAAEQAEKSFSTLVSNSPFAILLAERSGKIEFVNEEFISKTDMQISAKPFLKDVFAEFEPFGNMGFPIKTFLRDLKQSSNSNKHIDAGELCLNKNGSRSIFNCVATIIESRCILIFSDVTNAALAAEESRIMSEQLQAAQKFESLGTLAGGVAHDFNNILMSIMGYAELSLSELPEVGKLHDNISMIQTAAQRAAELTRQMLDFTGKNLLNIAPLELSEVVKEMATLLTVTISKKISVDFDLAKNVAVMADQSQLRQIVMNLVINAAEAIGDENGQINIRTGITDKFDKRIKSAMLAEINQAVDYFGFFEVSDTGNGIAPEMLAKIFDPFFTTKFTGRGLGLAAVVGIIKSHHGAINVQSSPGKGSCFRVFLPATSGELEISTAKTSQPLELVLNGKILLADDEETILTLTEMILEPYTTGLICVSDGEAAVEAVKENQHEIAVIILDMVMPKLSGYEAFSQIKAINSDIPIIISSGYSYNETKQKFAGREFDGFLQKPFKIHELINQINIVVKKTHS